MDALPVRLPEHKLPEFDDESFQASISSDAESFEENDRIDPDVILSDAIHAEDERPRYTAIECLYSPSSDAELDQSDLESDSESESDEEAGFADGSPHEGTDEDEGDEEDLIAENEEIEAIVRFVQQEGDEGEYDSDDVQDIEGTDSDYGSDDETENDTLQRRSSPPTISRRGKEWPGARATDALIQQGSPQPQPVSTSFLTAKQLVLDRVEKPLPNSPLFPMPIDHLKTYFDRATSSPAMKRYPQRPGIDVRESWYFQDPELHELWMDLVQTVRQDHSEVDESLLVCPSGSLHDPMKQLWHYPTYNTSQIEHGTVLDITNNTLMSHTRRVGGGDGSLYLDLYPLRMRLPKKSRRYSAPPQKLPDSLKKLLEDFTVRVLRRSKAHVGIVFGENPTKFTLHDMVRKSTDRIIRPIKLWRTPLYGMESQAMAECDKNSGDILCLWFIQFHGEAFTHRIWPQVLEQLQESIKMAFSIALPMHLVPDIHFFVTATQGKAFELQPQRPKKKVKKDVQEAARWNEADVKELMANDVAQHPTLDGVQSSSILYTPRGKRESKERWPARAALKFMLLEFFTGADISRDAFPTELSHAFVERVTIGSWHTRPGAIIRALLGVDDGLVGNVQETLALLDERTKEIIRKDNPRMLASKWWPTVAESSTKIRQNLQPLITAALKEPIFPERIGERPLKAAILDASTIAQSAAGPSRKKPHVVPYADRPERISNEAINIMDFYHERGWRSRKSGVSDARQRGAADRYHDWKSSSLANLRHHNTALAASFKRRQDDVDLLERSVSEWYKLQLSRVLKMATRSELEKKYSQHLEYVGGAEGRKYP